MMHMKYYKKLTGKRLYLSPISAEDAEQYTRWMNDLSITVRLGSSALTITLAGEREWIDKNSGNYQFAIVRLEDDRLLGNCGIEAIDHIHQTADVGIFLGEEEFRNKGFGTEALNLLAEYGFQYLNLHSLMLRVFSFNERAMACYRKAGFREIGRRRECYFLRGQFCDAVYMDLLREEWLAAQNTPQE